MHVDNFIVNLAGESKGYCDSHRTFTERKELMPMVTYSDLIQFVIMLCAIITLVIIIIRKK